MDKWNMYDFDGTIYDGDSSIDFMLFVFGKNKKLWWLIPKYLFFTILYFLHFLSSAQYKTIFFSFLKKIENVPELVTSFWNEKAKKIKPFFLEKLKTGEPLCVVSASPEFLLKPYFKNFENVTVVGTKMNLKTGVIEGENCKGKEKIKRINALYKKRIIQSFYTDSIADLPLTELAQESFLVTNNKIEPFDKQALLRKKENKTAFCLFVLFFTLYLILGIMLSYHHDFSKANNLLFDSDSPRVMQDMSDIFGNHYRLKVHPLFVLLVQPFILFLSGITMHKTLAIILFLSAITASTVSFLYKFACLFIQNEKIKLTMIGIFGFAFSNLIFTAGIELYNIAALGLVLFWYHVVIMMRKEKCQKKDYVFLFLLGIYLASITVTNFVVFLIGSLVLLLSKTVSFKKIVLLNIGVGICMIALSFFQNYVWHNTPIITDFSENYTEEESYMEKSVTLPQIKNVIKDDYVHALFGSRVDINLDTEYPMIVFSKISILSMLLSFIFYLFVLFFLIKKGRKNLVLNVGLLLTLLFNSTLHIIYGNSSAFLYALHFLYLPFLLFFVNYEESKKKKSRTWIFYILLGVLLFEVLNNLYRFKTILYLVSTVTNPNYFKAHFSLAFLLFFIAFIILVCYILCFLLYTCLKKAFSEKEKGKYILGILACLLFLECIFIGIETIPVYQKIANHRTGETSLKNVQTKKMSSSLKNAYPKEYQAYKNYAKEYKNFIQKYEATIVYELGNASYYFFGLGNRRKIIYKDGTLQDISTGDILEKWETKDSFIIPNLYTVLLETKTGEMIKIVETGEGLFIETKNQRKRVEGCQQKINLENFEGQKYQNMKKVLYSEILFNIKNSKPLPNILVYDEVWYRDAAMAAMVLKQTQNVNLIESFIEETTSMYDRQNGTEELDNLGQLLYLLSLVEKRDEDFIHKIIEEAEKRAKENPEGFYLNGKTDGQNHPVYQNAWYQFGLASLQKKTDMKLQKENDTYASLAWWYPLGENFLYNENETSIFPYLSWAQYHRIKSGSLYVSHRLYPLSYEKNGAYAHYKNLEKIDSFSASNKVSPTHIWTASEMLLFLLDETGNLKPLF